MSEAMKLRDRIESRRSGVVDDDPDTFDDWGTFGLLRGTRDRALMLDLRLKSGNREAISYSLLERVSFDPSQGLTLKFFGVLVQLKGRNLSSTVGTNTSLLEGIHRHRVPWVREIEEVRSWTKAEEVPVITQIFVELMR